jgi:hypothetical protein
MALTPSQSTVGWNTGMQMEPFAQRQLSDNLFQQKTMGSLGNLAKVDLIECDTDYQLQAGPLSQCTFIPFLYPIYQTCLAFIKKT